MVDSFFLGTSTRLFGAGQGGEGVVRGLYMQNNLGNSVELLGNFSKATNCLISGPSSPFAFSLFRTRIATWYTYRVETGPLLYQD